jgi:hypothetical protein
MKKIVLMLSLTVGLTGMSSLVHADLISFMKGVNKQALSDITSFNDKLSKQFGVPVPNVEAIVKSLPDPADAFMVLQVSQMAHVAPEVVIEKYHRNREKGWGNMAHEMGIKPGSAEFHALKSGNLSFTGRRHRDDMDRDEREDRHEYRNKHDYEDERGHGRGREHGHGRGNDRD